MTGAARRSYQGFWEQKNRQASGVFAVFTATTKNACNFVPTLTGPISSVNKKIVSIFDLDGQLRPGLVFRHFLDPREKILGNVAHPGARELGQPLARIGSVLKDDSFVSESSIFKEVLHHRLMNPIGFATP
jgi:hypothetical protein